MAKKPEIKLEHENPENVWSLLLMVWLQIYEVLGCGDSQASPNAVSPGQMSSVGSNDPFQGSEQQQIQMSSVGSNDPHECSEVQQSLQSSVGSNSPHQVSQLHRCQMSISYDPYYQSSELHQWSSVGSNDPHGNGELGQSHRNSVGSNAPHQGSELHRCLMSISHDLYHQGSELPQRHRSSVGSNDPYEGSELRQPQSSSVGFNAPRQGSELHRCQMNISHNPFQGSEQQQLQRTSVGLNDPQQGSKRKHCEISLVGSNAPHQDSKRQDCRINSVGLNDQNQGSELRRVRRSLVGSVEPHQGSELKQDSRNSMGANDPHRSIELQQHLASSSRPSIHRSFKRKRGIAKRTSADRFRRLRTEMEEISKEQELIKGSQRQVGKLFETIEEGCEQPRRETDKITRQSVNTQIRLSLMFQILKAREEGDSTLASNLTQLLREFCAIMEQGSNPKKKK